MKRSVGLTLIEVLVTVSLLGMVLGLVSQFFMVQTRAAQFQKASNEVGDSARIALSLITWDIQNAGYLVNTSTVNPAIAATSDNTAQPLADAFTTRYFSRDINNGSEQTVTYSIQDNALLRAQYTTGTTPSSQTPTVASIAALNVLYETRANQFELPTGTGNGKTCPTGSPEPKGATGAAITNCKVSWVWSNKPERLVRQVKVQLLARSSLRVSGRNATTTYTFDTPDNENVLTFTTTPGYVYQFAEQTVVAANLGR